MQHFYQVPAPDLTPELLHEQMRSRGYVHIRGVLPRDAVTSVLDDVTGILSAAGWLMPGRDPRDRYAEMQAACGDPDPSFKRTYQHVFNLETFHALPHHPELRKIMQMMVGDQIIVHPKPIGRLIFPNCDRLVVHAHQDYEFMGGDPECYTVWIPLHDCPVKMGPLRILEGSHRHGVVSHQREDLHVPEISTAAIEENDWVGGDVAAGDILLFHSLTVHAASPNLSDQMRLSIDCRFQDARRALNPANLAFAGESGKSWEKTYAGWHADDLKFYWKKLPLTFKPSKAELQELVLTADSPKARAKFARIVSQLD